MPPDDAELEAFFGGEERVTRDPGRMEGWDYEEATNTVMFFGDACARIREGDVVDVDVVFGCGISD